MWGNLYIQIDKAKNPNESSIMQKQATCEDHPNAAIISEPKLSKMDLEV